MIDRRGLFRSVGAAGVLALPGSTTRTPGIVAATAGGIAIAADLAQLRAAPAATGAMLWNGAIYHWRSGDHSEPPLGPEDDLRVIKQDKVALSAGAWVRQFDMLSVKAFGAVTGTDASPETNDAAFEQAIATAAASGFPLHLDGGVYRLSAEGGGGRRVNFARSGLRIKGGGATLVFVGQGRALVLDRGGHDGDFLENMSIEDIVIVGGPSVTDGFYSRGIVRSSFRNIEVRDVCGKAFHIRHGVSSHFDGLKYSADPKASFHATHGLYVDANGEGYYTANCVFTNAVMEGFPGIGCQLENASGLMFAGGTFEACAVGLIVSSTSSDNLFAKLWLEANRVADVVVSGTNNGFIGVKCMSTTPDSNVRILDDSGATWFAGGGYVRSVNIAARASGTSFHQVGVDVNLGGQIGFQGHGRFTRIGCVKIGEGNKVVGAYPDILGAIQSIGTSGAWTPKLVADRGEIALNKKLTQGSFQRIGNLVFAQCFIYVDRVTEPMGGLAIRDLPFASVSRQPGSVFATQLRTSSASSIQVRADPGDRRLQLSMLSNGAAAAMAEEVRAGTTLAVSITYTAAY